MTPRINAPGMHCLVNFNRMVIETRRPSIPPLFPGRRRHPSASYGYIVITMKVDYLHLRPVSFCSMDSLVLLSHFCLVISDKVSTNDVERGPATIPSPLRKLSSQVTECQIGNSSRKIRLAI